jgi:hypothetical protein
MGEVLSNARRSGTGYDEIAKRFGVVKDAFTFIHDANKCERLAPSNSTIAILLCPVLSV